VKGEIEAESKERSEEILKEIVLEEELEKYAYD
jgi:hypothetical protein